MRRRWSLSVIAFGIVLGAACTGTIRVSSGTSGAAAQGSSFLPAADATGRFVAFSSDASDHVADDHNDATDVFVRDTRANTTNLASVASDGSQALGNSFGA